MSNPPPSSSFALTLIFEQLELVYEKLCEGSILLSLSGCPELIKSDGDFATFSIVFDNLDTPIKPAVEAVISVQFIDFTAWLNQKVAAATPSNQGNQPSQSSDCELLKICGLRSELNNLIKSLENTAYSPERLSQRVSEVIAELKGRIESGIAASELIEFETPKVWDNQGKLKFDSTFSFEDSNSDAEIQRIEADLNKFFLDLLKTIDIATKPFVPDTLPGGNS
ncbi:MAG: hypothetical protein SFT94_05595 [Pseudanabaenaceae cyanobacterium bins.68]|nr:hypothetical protein [Pseudanabaenaceae cyanobacterium bins.68]